MRIRRSFWYMAVALLLAGCGGDGGTDPTPIDGGGGGGNQTPVASATVTAGNSNQFSPRSVLLSRGGTVTWTFGSVSHNVVFSTTGAPANIPVSDNASVSRTFPNAGSFPYDCTLHAGMTGTVTVQ